VIVASLRQRSRTERLDITRRQPACGLLHFSAPRPRPGGWAVPPGECHGRRAHQDLLEERHRHTLGHVRHLAPVCHDRSPKSNSQVILPLRQPGRRCGRWRSNLLGRESGPHPASRDGWCGQNEHAFMAWHPSSRFRKADRLADEFNSASMSSRQRITGPGPPPA